MAPNDHFLKVPTCRVSLHHHSKKNLSPAHAACMTLLFKDISLLEINAHILCIFGRLCYLFYFKILQKHIGFEIHFITPPSSPF